MKISDLSEEEKDTLELLKEKDKLNNNQHLRQLARKLADDGDGKKEGFVLEEALMEGDEEEQEILDQLELDSESLANLEEKVTSEVREKLSELGLPSEGGESEKSKKNYFFFLLKLCFSHNKFHLCIPLIK